jgi:hypothetical protein
MMSWKRDEEREEKRAVSLQVTFNGCNTNSNKIGDRIREER